MKRSAELQLRPVRRAKDKLIAPGGSPALQFHGSLSQCIRKNERRLSTNPSPINAPLSSLRNLATYAASFVGGDKPGFTGANRAESLENYLQAQAA